MILLGVILLVLGWVLAIPILLYVGIALLIIGAVLAVSGNVGGGRYRVAGRRHWF